MAHSHLAKGWKSGLRGRCGSIRCSARPIRHVLLVPLVTFEPSARTAWHTHPLGQTLIAEVDIDEILSQESLKCRTSS